MKNFLLIFLAFGIAGSLVAQNKTLRVNGWKNYTAKKGQIESQITEHEYGLETNEYVSNFRDGEDIVFGTSYYDLQTNSCVPNHIYAYPDGTMASVWTMSHELEGFPNCPDRGTGYNYYDGTAWGAYPTERIEPDRNGWPNYAPYGENGEIVCSHTGIADGLIFSHRPNKGTGEWSNFYLVGPADHENLLWPRMITAGENNETIHVFALTEPVANGGTPYEGLDGALLYSRSTDGGETWDPENVILEGLTSDDVGYISADNYTWAQPRDGVIAFSLMNGVADGLIFKSEDDGDNWEIITFFNSPYPLNDGSVPFNLYYSIDGAGDLLIDDEGKIHVSAGRTFYTSGDAPGIYYGYGVNVLIYWNEEMPAMDSTLLGDVDAMEEAGVLAAGVEQADETGDTVQT